MARLDTLLRAALLLLLLSMQGFTLAHELDKGAAHDSSVCASCSVSSGHEGIHSSTIDCPVIVSTGNEPVVARITAPVAVFHQHPQARAPPLTL